MKCPSKTTLSILRYVLVSTIFLVPGCAHSGTSSVPDKVVIGTFSRAIDYAPFYVARHFKWFEARLKDVGVPNPPAYVEFGGIPEISSALQQDKLDAFFSAEAPATILNAGGNDIRIVEVSCTLQQEIVVRSSLAVRSVSDLRGHKVAVLSGTSSHYGLLKILKANSLIPSSPDSPGAAFDVEIVFMPPPAARAAFDADQIDAWAVWPPFVEQLSVSGRGTVLKGGDAVIQSVMTVPQRLITKNNTTAKALIGAIQAAKRWMTTNPDEAQDIVAQSLELDVQIVKAAWPKHNWSATLTPDVLRDIEDKDHFLADQRLTPIRKYWEW